MTEQREKSNGGMTRRQFLTRVARAGGAAALYETMVTLGLLGVPTAWAGMPKLRPQQGAGSSVLILGAGIGGLTTAYLLSKYGYRVRVLEATHRAGGRSLTARRGDVVMEESAEHGRTYQECELDDGLYLNLGPGRLPYHHRRVLGYCQELGVALQPYIMNTTGNLFQTDAAFDGQPKSYRQVQNDTRGYVSELLAKAIDQKALNEILSPEDRQKLLGLLKVFGPLKDDYSYAGSTRHGCGVDPQGHPTPNVYYNCLVGGKLSPEALLESEFWQNSFYDPFEIDWQPTLFQPVGGMDMIVEGFKRRIGDLITYDAPVVKIELDAESVSVTYVQGGRQVTERADYCVSNIPCPILKEIPNNFAADLADAVARTTFDASCKVGWQCNTRFWEDRKYQIYGGISWTDHIIEQIWYPSNDFFGQKGTLTGAYIHDDPPADHATRFGSLSLEERLKLAREGGRRLHPEFADESIVPNEKGLSIAWQNVPYQRGAWPSWAETGQHANKDYRRLLLPDRRFHITGDQASTLPGWQEGAMMSAEHVVELIGGLRSAESVTEDIVAPNTARVRRGRE